MIDINDIKLIPTKKKDYFRLFLNGVDVFGQQERSFFRHVLQVMDNGIDC